MKIKRIFFWKLGKKEKEKEKEKEEEEEEEVH